MPTSLTDTAHLLRRTWGLTDLASAESMMSYSRAELVDLVLDFSPNPASDFDPAAKSSNWENLQALRVWWLDRMATVPRPLQERLTLFWHNHFATSMNKVFDPRHMYSQNQIFRTLGSGDLNELFKAVSTDPAMLHWLDGVWSGKWGPNENFGRELQELFLFGADNGYTEVDVKSMARAWTGHSLDFNNGETYLFKPIWHDNDPKSLYGVVANWDGPAALDAIMVSGGALNTMRTRVSEHIAAKLWSWFAYPIKRTDALAVQLGAQLAADSKMNVTKFLRVMFNRDEFYSQQAKQGLLRNPIDWVVAMMRSTGVRADVSQMPYLLDNLGMGPLQPPNVSGWRQNKAWMSVSAYWRRADTADSVMSIACADPTKGGSSLLNTIDSMTSAAAVTATLRQLGEDRIDPVSPTFAALVSLVNAERSAKTGGGQRQSVARAVAISPEYSLA